MYIILFVQCFSSSQPTTTAKKYIKTKYIQQKKASILMGYERGFNMYVYLCVYVYITHPPSLQPVRVVKKIEKKIEWREKSMDDVDVVDDDDDDDGIERDYTHTHTLTLSKIFVSMGICMHVHAIACCLFPYVVFYYAGGGGVLAHFSNVVFPAPLITLYPDIHTLATTPLQTIPFGEEAAALFDVGTFFCLGFPFSVLLVSKHYRSKKKTSNLLVFH